jgi:GNAT superfamily N-acetyltransferase/SAM-dependent methyltransferase
VAILPFYGADAPELFALERRSVDRPGRVVARLDGLLPSAGTVLDVGAGDGWTAQRLASPERRVLAVEPSAGMLAQRRTSPDVTWVRAEAGALPFADGSVDAAYATWAYFFPSWRDPSRGLAELYRVVAPGGAIVVVNNAGDDAFTGLGVASGGEDLDWFRARGFDVQVVDTVVDFDDEPDGLVADLLARYLGDPAAVPDPLPRRLDHRVAVAETTSRGPGRVHVRGMQLADAAAVGALTLAAYDAYGRLEGDYRHQLGDPLRRRDGASAILVAEVDGQVAGTVTYVVPDDAEWEGRPTPEADGGFRVLAVHPDHEGQGVGRALVQACLDRAREDGRRRMAITSMAWMTRAHALYRSFGFQRRPDLDVRFPSGDGHVFTLDLTDDAADHFPPPGSVPASPPWFEDVWAL